MVLIDFDGDRRLDLFFTASAGAEGDGKGLMLRNLGGWEFEPVDAAPTRASWKSGLAWDFDGDADTDLLVVGDAFGLFRNEGDGRFVDATVEARLHECPAGPVSCVDHDRDGDLDLLVDDGDGVRLLRNNGDGTLTPAGAENLEPIPAPTEADFDHDGRTEPFTRVVGRAQVLGLGDLDNDGDLDIITASPAGAPRILENVAPKIGRWIGFRLLDLRGCYATGAEVELITNMGIQRGQSRATSANGLASDPRVHFGFEAGARLRRVRVHWPDGTVEAFPPPPASDYRRIFAGAGRMRGQARKE